MATPFDFIKNLAGNVIDSVQPECYACGARAVPLRCEMCGENFSCLAHGFFSTRPSSICQECVDVGWEEEGGEENDETITFFPWSILEIPQTTNKAHITKAFRVRARDHHPDKKGDPETFKKIRDAYEIAIKIAEETNK